MATNNLRPKKLELCIQADMVNVLRKIVKAHLIPLSQALLSNKVSKRTKKRNYVVELFIYIF